MIYPALAVILPTYNRAETVWQTIDLLQRNLVYSGYVEYFVGCDGDDHTPEKLSDMKYTNILEEPSGSFGANINRLIKLAIDTGFDFFMQMDDDHWLMEPMDINNFIKDLDRLEDAGWIRLMGIGAHDLRATLKGVYWYVDWDSPELYITSMRPHIKHVRFIESFGFYPEGEKLGLTEEGYCHQCKNSATEDSPKVLVPLDTRTESSWSHVGKSWQAKGH